MKIESNKTLIVSGLFILFGALSRLLTFLPNFSALESLALFGGAYIATRYIALAIPLIALYFSDLILNNTLYRSFYPDVEGFVFFSDYMIWSFISLILIVLFGKVILKKVSFLSATFGILGATTIFWLISNFGAWLSMGLFPKTFAGLIANYEFALPFFQYSLLGNFAFGTVLFGSYELLRITFPKLVTQKQEI